MIDLSTFSGEIPRLSAKLLPKANAATAENCDLDSGNLKPMTGITSGIESLSPTINTIYKYGENFLTFTSAAVNIVRSFVSSSGRLVYTGDGYPKEYDGSTHIRLGIEPPTAALTIHMSGIAPDENATATSISYVYTRVSKRADGSDVESAPSPPTAVVTLQTGMTIAVSGFSVADIPDGTVVSHYRLYRLNAGVVTGAEYQFVMELTVAAAVGEITDDVEDADLGEVLPTTYWTDPPDALSGLIATSHGMVYGFVGNRIYPSETFIPYAFPEIYSLTTESDIVALGYTGSMVVVLTETVPYLLYGQSPESLELKRLGHAQPCVSARSVVNIPGGVVYAAPDGLFLINESGQGSLITRKLFTRSQWDAMGPASAIGFHYDESYLCFFNDTKTGFQIHLESGRYQVYAMADEIYGGIYSPEDDVLYLIEKHLSVREIASWRTGADISFSWKSKIFLFPYYMAMTAGMIQGVFDGETVYLTLYVDGVALDTITVSTDAVFRIPPVLGTEFQILIEGSAVVDRVLIGRSFGEVVNA